MKQGGFSSISKFVTTGVFLVVSLYYLKDLLIPILYGALLSVLFLPIANFLEKKKFPRIVAILTCLFIMIVSIAGIGILLYAELATLSHDLPLFEQKAWQAFSQVQLLFEKLSHVSVKAQTEWIQKNHSKMLTASSDIVKSLLMGISQGLQIFIFVIMYFFFFLLLRDRFRNFAFRLFQEQHHSGLNSVLQKTQIITRKYLVGQLTVMAIIGLLNSIGFLIIGVKQAFFWGFLRGLLNIIPYVGSIIGAIFPTLSVLTYKEGISSPLAVIGVVVITQLIQDNLLIPKIVGSSIKLNPLTPIMAILLGGMLWGLNGMILFLPLAGIIKVVFDNVESLKPFGYLLGDE